MCELCVIYMCIFSDLCAIMIHILCAFLVVLCDSVSDSERSTLYNRNSKVMSDRGNERKKHKNDKRMTGGINST